MHNLALPIVAAIACAVCNGTAAVLQKISADTVKTARSLDAGLLWRLFQNRLYVFGIVLDIFGWLLTLYAVQNLPLFLVESVIAASIVVTALIERVVRHAQLSWQAYSAIGLIIFGLILLAVASSPEKAEPVSETLRIVIALSPLPLFLLGVVAARQKNNRSAFILAAISGLSFGATSVMGRIFDASRPLWHTIYNPLLLGLIVSGTLGVLLFSTALQRGAATTVNATMTASQTIIPAIVGIVFLGDNAKQGLWYMATFGVILALGGVTALALIRVRTPAKDKGLI